MRDSVRSFGHTEQNLQLEEARIKKIISRSDKVWTHMVAEENQMIRRGKKQIKIVPRKKIMIAKKISSV